MRRDQQKRYPEKKHLVKWKCEECGRGFTTVVKSSEVEEWSPKNLPVIPSCLECGEERVFYQGQEELGAAVPKEFRRNGGSQGVSSEAHKSDGSTSDGEIPSGPTARRKDDNDAYPA